MAGLVPASTVFAGGGETDATSSGAGRSSGSRSQGACTGRLGSGTKFLI
jgi:hypothetical protein